MRNGMRVLLAAVFGLAVLWGLHSGTLAQETGGATLPVAGGKGEQQGPAAEKQRPMEGRLNAFLGEPLFQKQMLYGNGRTRGPNITVGVNGTVLARGAGQLRRSKDGGKTWGEPQKAPPGLLVVDETTGDVLSVHTRGENRLWRSTDHGKTWREERIELKPNAAMIELGEPAQHPGCIHQGGAESGITIRHGDGGLHGRLLLPARYQPYGSNDREHWAGNYNTAIYSDDAGRTWQVSGFFPEGWTGEGALVELADGRVYYNSRTHNPKTDKRRMAFSYDSGETWTDLEVVDSLYDGGGYGRGYGLMGGLVRLPVKNQDILVFSNADTQGGDRLRMTVWASFDGGRTWPLKRLVYAGPSAYSSLAAGRPDTPTDGRIYLLFEGAPGGRYNGIQVACFNLAWLLEGEPTGDGEVPEDVGW